MDESHDDEHAGQGPVQADRDTHTGDRINYWPAMHGGDLERERRRCVVARSPARLAGQVRERGL